MRQYLILLFFLLSSTITITAQSWQEISKIVGPDYPSYLPNQQYGYSLAIDGDYAVIGAPLGSDDSGIAYILFYNGIEWVQKAQLTASDGGTDDAFGSSVSISGNFIVIGAHQNDENGTNSGAAYVYEMPSGGWVDTTENAKLTALAGVANDKFGYSVALSGDNVVIGAYLNSTNGLNSGMAYVFTKPLGGWVDTTETSKLAPSAPASSDWFGYSVGISGDNIIIGCPNKAVSNPNTGSGVLYVFSKPTGAWVDTTETAKLSFQDNLTYKSFGNSVSIDGDYIVGGALGFFTPSFSVGAAFVFEKPTNGWVDTFQTAKLTASNGLLADNYGNSVSISGDDIIVGAYQDNNTTNNFGLAYVYTKPTSGWTNMSETAKLTASDGASKDFFGFCVGISGSHTLIGAYQDDDYGSETGAVYSFDKPSSGWMDTTETEKEVPIYYSYTGNFGASTDIDGDYAITRGHKTVYVFHYNGNTWLNIATLKASDSTDTGFGQSISISGNNIVVGGLEIAYVFTMPPTGWVNMTETAQLTASDGVNLDHFGYSVDIDGDTIVVGAPGDDNNLGAAYLFIKPVWGWWASTTEDAKLTALGNSNRLGESVSISGNNIAVGAPGGSSVYVFSKPTSGWSTMTETARLHSSDNLALQFGIQVCISGDNIVVRTQSPYIYYKSIYVFKKPMLGWSNMTETAKLTTSEGQLTISSISISGDIILAGNFNNLYNGNNTGAVFLYKKPNTGWVDTTEITKIMVSDTTRPNKLGWSVAISGTNIIIGNPWPYNYTPGSVYFFKQTSTISIEKIATNDNNIKYYPNPITNHLTIESKERLKSIELIDIKGSIIKNIQTSEQQITLNTNDIHAGIYFCRIITETDTIFSQKLIKQ